MLASEREAAQGVERIEMINIVVKAWQVAVMVGALRILTVLFFDTLGVCFGGGCVKKFIGSVARADS